MNAWTGRAAGSFAAAVSRAIRAQGIRPLPSGMPRGTEGVRVERSPIRDTAHVRVVIWDDPYHRRTLCEAVDEALAATKYTVERRDTDSWSVTR